METKSEDDESDGERISRLAQELGDLITAADLPDELHMLLWKNIEAIIHGVRMIKILGPDGVVEEYERFIGVLFLTPKAGSEIAKRPSVLAKFNELGKSIVLLGAASAVPGQLALSAGEAVKAIEPIYKAITGQ